MGYAAFPVEKDELVQKALSFKGERNISEIRVLVMLLLPPKRGNMKPLYAESGNLSS